MATYYVDATTGGGDFTTIAQVNAHTFAPGDFIYFARGCTWQEKLTIGQSGTNGYPITYGAYGGGADPKIFGPQDQCIYGSGKKHITIMGLEIAHSNGPGIKNYNAGDYWIIMGNTIHDCGAANASTAHGVELAGASSCIVSNNIIYQCGTHGIYVYAAGGSTASSNIIEDNTVYDCYHSGIDIMNISGTMSGNIVRRNLVYTTAEYAYPSLGMNHIFLEGNSGYPNDAPRVYYNICHTLMGKGIQVSAYVIDPVIYNNTVYGTSASIGGLFSDGIDINGLGITGAVIKNNIVMDVNTACFRFKDETLIAVCDNNCWYQSAGGTLPYVQKITGSTYHYNDQAAYKTAFGFDTAGLWENPKFVNAAGHDFHLLSSSPCIGAGADVGLTEDHDGHAIEGSPDIGAYEYQEQTMSIKKSVPITLVVTAAPDFFPAVVPSSVSVAKGVVAVYNVSFTAQGGFTGPVTLAVLNLPAGAVATFNTTSINVGETSVLNLTTAGVALGTFAFSVEGDANI